MSQYWAGVDLGGTTIKAALADEQGQIVARDAIPTSSHEGPAKVVERMGDLVAKLLGQASGARTSQLAAVGIGVPGLADLQTGTTRFLPNMPTQWREVPVATWLGKRLDCPVRLLNDVRAATLGELRFGHGKHRPGVTMAFFSIGTGIGGGVAIEGRLRLGPLGAAGELGHQTILPDGPRCGCGNRGCLETLASGPSLAAEGLRLMQSGLAPRLFEIVAGRTDAITPREMLQAAEAGDALVREVLERAGQYLGIAAANVVTTLHPDLIVLGGGVAALGDVLLDQVRAVIRQRVGMFPTDGVQVERSLLADQAGLLGAVALAGERS